MNHYNLIGTFTQIQYFFVCLFDFFFCFCCYLSFPLALCAVGATEFDISRGWPQSDLGFLECVRQSTLKHLIKVEGLAFDNRQRS